MAKLRITYKKSAIGYSQAQKDTVRSLGLHKLNSVALQDDSPAIRGMIFKVKHLVAVEEVADAATGAATQLVAVRTTLIAPQVVHDDIEIVEGIGPKIAGVLRDEGISTFARLAATSVAQLEEILAAHKLSQITEPATWPEQARLADVGDFEALKAYQVTLRAGRAS